MQIRAVADAYAGSGDRGMREIFIALAYDIVDKLQAHLAREDALFYPLARKIISTEQLQDLECALKAENEELF